MLITEKTVNNAKAIRLIQITDNELKKIQIQYRNNEFWNLDVCRRIAMKKVSAEHMAFNTTLHFYRNNISDPSFRNYAVVSYGVWIDNQLNRLINQSQISQFEYYNSTCRKSFMVELY